MQKHKVLEHIMHWYTCRWCNKHRDMWEVTGDNYMYLTYYVAFSWNRNKELPAKMQGFDSLKKSVFYYLERGI